jgi:predicted Zn finger-like uncharacterized protein
MPADPFVAFIHLKTPQGDPMLVKCPSCATTYRVSEEVLTAAAPIFRCSRCKHTFEYEHETRPVTSGSVLKPGAVAEAVHAENELSFTFDSKNDLRHSFQDDLLESSQPDVAASSPSNGRNEAADQWSLAEEAVENHEKPVSSDGRKHSDHEGIDKGSSRFEEKPLTAIPAHFENGANILALEPYRDQQASIIPYLTLFALLTLAFSLFTAFHYAYPQAMDGWIRKIPLLGGAVVRNAHLKNGVLLQSVRGSYQTIQGNREVFLVTGTAINQNPVIIREVRIGGDSYGADGKIVEQQTMWIGNAISPKIVRGMTAQDIADLQRLKPLKSFDIPPGDSVPFTMIFLKSPKGIKEFTCQILGAEEDL